jgi:hypothetical protein
MSPETPIIKMQPQRIDTFSRFDMAPNLNGFSTMFNVNHANRNEQSTAISLNSKGGISL